MQPSWLFISDCHDDGARDYRNSDGAGLGPFPPREELIAHQLDQLRNNGLGEHYSDATLQAAAEAWADAWLVSAVIARDAEQRRALSNFEAALARLVNAAFNVAAAYEAAQFCGVNDKINDAWAGSALLGVDELASELSDIHDRLTR